MSTPVMYREDENINKSLKFIISKQKHLIEMTDCQLAATLRLVQVEIKNKDAIIDKQQHENQELKARLNVQNECTKSMEKNCELWMRVVRDQYAIETKKLESIIESMKVQLSSMCNEIIFLKRCIPENQVQHEFPH
jgi:predicted RNase H-like nuclease (RuvC/YqgF family)